MAATLSNQIASERKYRDASKRFMGISAAQLKGEKQAKESAVKSRSMQEHEQNGQRAANRAYKTPKSREQFLAGWMAAWDQRWRA
jgi:hypothetical protein